MGQLFNGEFLITNNIFDQIANRDDSDQFSLVNDGKMANSLVAHYCHAFLNSLIGLGGQDLVFHDVPDSRGR